MPSLFQTDPLTAGWLLVIALIFTAVVAVPLLRALVAVCLFALAAATGRQRLQHTAVRVMPRFMHLVGGLVIGTASLAAPALATTEGPVALLGIDLDRDAGASRAAAPQPAVTAHTATTAAAVDGPAQRPASAAPTVSTMRDATASTAPSASTVGSLYVVRTGDSLWAIAEHQLETPNHAEITEGWKAIWRANRAVIGDDPGLILPGQQLDLGVLA